MHFEFLFLGTGAADRMNIPPEKDFSDKDKRRCSAALINGHILIDCGPHVLNALSIAQIPLENITDILITHLHPDHFCPDAIMEMAQHNSDLKIWMREDAVCSLPEGCHVQKMQCFQEYIVGELSVTAVPANHAAFAIHFSIVCGDKKLFYGMDGAWFLGEAVDFMKDKRYDMFVFDATVGDYLGDYRMGEHNSIPMIRMMLPSMKTLNICHSQTAIVLNHLAVCLHKSHRETCELVKNDYFTIAFDGLRLEI